MELGSRPCSVGAERLGCLLAGLQLATLVLHFLLGPGQTSEKDRKTNAQVLGCVMETVVEGWRRLQEEKGSQCSFRETEERQATKASLKS